MTDKYGMSPLLTRRRPGTFRPPLAANFTRLVKHRGVMCRRSPYLPVTNASHRCMVMLIMPVPMSQLGRSLGHGVDP